VTIETTAIERETQRERVVVTIRAPVSCCFLSHYQIINVLGIRALREGDEEEEFVVCPFFVVVASLLFSTELCHKFG
jgi:hypothetical protein